MEEIKRSHVAAYFANRNTELINNKQGLGQFIYWDLRGSIQKQRVGGLYLFIR